MPGPIRVVDDALRASWATAVQFPWQHEARINALEAEAYLSTFRHIARNSANVNSQVVLGCRRQMEVGQLPSQFSAAPSVRRASSF